MANGELQCTSYDDSERQIFRSQQECNKQASFRFYGMTELFDAYDIPYDTCLLYTSDAADE